MIQDTGYKYFKEASSWPGFILDDPLGPRVEITANGSLILRRSAGGNYAPKGVIVGGPFDAQTDQPVWHRLQVFTDSLPDGAHIQLYSTTVAAGESDPTFDVNALDPFPGWHQAPRDVLDFLLPQPSSARLWIGAVLRSNGSASPVIRQMRADYGRDTYLQYLPAIFSRGDQPRDLAERALSLFESVLGGIESEIDDLTLLFDPAAAPDEGFPSWLVWLAGWLAFDMNENWSKQAARSNLAQAYDLHRQRGTVSGLRRYLEMYAGVKAHVSEPGLQTHLWSLEETSSLGFTTMLAPAEPQGAVLGTSATMDHAHITQFEQYGAAVFDDLAHHFCVQIYCGDLRYPGSLEDARQVIEQEKPAHTTYHLCLIEPRFRVGMQAHLGINTVVGGGQPAAHIGDVLGTGVITAEPVAPKMKLGIQSRTGIDSVVAGNNNDTDSH